MVKTQISLNIGLPEKGGFPHIIQYVELCGQKAIKYAGFVFNLIFFEDYVETTESLVRAKITDKGNGFAGSGSKNR